MQHMDCTCTHLQGQGSGSNRSAGQQHQQPRELEGQQQQQQQQQNEQHSSECKLTAETARATSSSTHACAECGMTDGGLQKCGGCGVVRYCSAACQRKAWPAHKKECKHAAFKKEAVRPA
eukprot:1158837-Pelagomonas_calceolata.AAC.1